MTTDTLDEYVALRKQLDREREELEARLGQIHQVLSGKGGYKPSRPAARAVSRTAGIARRPAAGAHAPVRRKLSAAGRARLSARAKARWKIARALGKSTL